MPRRPCRAYHFVAALVVVGGLVHDILTHRFDNGLTLHVASGHPSPVAAVQAWVGVGSVDEGPRQAGMAHLVEHMLFKGSSRYGLGELVHSIERGGGEVNAWTAFDHTVYHAVLASDHVDGAVDALGDALTAPRVDPDELAREREVVVEEIRQGADNPSRSVAQSLFATAYVAHPYRRPVIGTPDSVRGIGERDLVEFFRSFYVADNLTLVVAGDVDPDRIRRSVERRFRTMPSGRPTRCAVAEPAQTAPRATCHARELGEAYLAVGFHVPSARHPDLAALDVAAILLGQSESARLPRLLRDRDGLVTSAYATVHALRDPGLLVLSATARAANAPKTIRALVEQSTEIADELSSDDLEKARIAVESGFVRQLETAQGRARSIGWHATTTGDPQFGHVYLDRVRAVRRHDVVGAIRRYLRPDNANIAALVPARRNAQPHVWARRAERSVQPRRVARATPTAAPVEKRVVLGNGMTLLVRRDASVPVVAMRGVWRGGLRVESDQRAGASTLIARLVARGCGKLDGTAVADKIDRLGGSLAGVAGRNSFGITSEWLARSWKPGLDLLADCILDPAFAHADLQREQQLLLEDQEAGTQNPTQVAFRLFSEALYGTHPYARDILGTPAAVTAITRDQLLAFYREQYPVSGLTLAIVGDIEIDEVIAHVRARFEATKAPRAAKPAAKPYTPPAKPAEVYRYLERSQAHLVVGFPGATLDAKDRFALELLVAILGGQSGRLFAELRDKRALVYRISAHSIEGVDPGFVAIYLSCAPDKLDEAVAAVRGELDRVRTDGVTPAELERARAHLIGNQQIAMQRRAAVANAMAYHEAYGLGWQTWNGYADAIRNVRPADIVAAAATYLRTDRMVVATVRPPAATPAAAKRSKTRAPTTKSKAPARPTRPPRSTTRRPRGNA